LPGALDGKWDFCPEVLLSESCGCDRYGRAKFSRAPVCFGERGLISVPFGRISGIDKMNRNRHSR
jgi:hypothetical protein